MSLTVLPPLIGHGHGGVDTAAQADVVERVDDLNTDSVRARFIKLYLGEDECVDHAGVRDGPGKNWI